MKNSNNQAKRSGPLQRIMQRQQQNMHLTKQTSALLATYADNDPKLIAMLINKWISADK